MAFFTPVTVDGRQLTAVGVVLGQGEGSDTQALLAAAGPNRPAARRLDHPQDRRKRDRCARRGRRAPAQTLAPGPPTAAAELTQTTTAREHMRTERWSRAAPALIALAGLISSCGASASAGTGGGGSGNTAAGVQQAVKFAQCIRSNGVPDFPDPLPNGPLVDTNRIPSANQPGGMSALHAAMQTCSAAAAAAGVQR